MPLPGSGAGAEASIHDAGRGPTPLSPGSLHGPLGAV